MARVATILRQIGFVAGKVQVLDRALAALAILANSPSDCSLAELCPALKLHKSTVHRLMMVLEQHRLVVKNPDTGRYRLGLRLYELGSRAIHGLDLQRGRARPYLDRLQDEFGEDGKLLTFWTREKRLP